MDFAIRDEGSIKLVVPLTDAAREWLEQNVQEDALYFGTGLAVEHRFLDPLVDGLKRDGFRVIAEGE